MELFNVVQYRDDMESNKPTSIKMLGEGLPLESAKKVFKKYEHRHGQLFKAMYTTIKVELITG